MDENTCMVDLAKFFLSFTRESRAANACRAAWAQTDAGDLAAHHRGKGVLEDLDALKELAP